MGRRSHRSRHGFGTPPLRPFTNMMGVRGGAKREFLNQLAIVMAVGVGLLGAFVGGSWLGFWGAVVGFLVGCCAGGAFAAGGRYFR